MSGYNTYQRTQIATADRRKIVVLLYEGAISRLNQAIAAIGTGANEKRTSSITKALDIIHFLNNGLDFERGGEIAQNLQRLYDYVRDIVSEGNISGDVKKLEEAIRLLSMLLDAWKTICTQGNVATPPILEQRAREAVAAVG